MKKSPCQDGWVQILRLLWPTTLDSPPNRLRSSRKRAGEFSAKQTEKLRVPCRIGPAADLQTRFIFFCYRFSERLSSFGAYQLSWLESGEITRTLDYASPLREPGSESGHLRSVSSG